MKKHVTKYQHALEDIALRSAQKANKVIGKFSKDTAMELEELAAISMALQKPKKAHQYIKAANACYFIEYISHEVDTLLTQYNKKEKL